jgi:signal transduction histidine kinase
VFQAFFTTKKQGLGLGLSLSLKIIKLHGGTIHLHNNPMVGVTAAFTLPRSNALLAAG